MRLLIQIICLLVTFTIVAHEVPPHLILHFDVNKTLIASDKANSSSIDDVLNQLLAHKYRYRWDPSISNPISYENYVESLYPSKKKNLTSHFLDFLEQNEHPLYEEVLKEFLHAKTILNESPNQIFPSFFFLLCDLDNKKISYSVILRSFGFDIEEVVEGINLVRNNMITHSGMFREGKLILENEVIENSEDIYLTLLKRGHMAIQDDWIYWSSHRAAASYGKPFYIHPKDEGTLTIFFDDHIHLDDSITNIIAPKDALTNEDLPIKELVKKHQVVKVDTWEAIMNTNYFIEQVEEALKARVNEESIAA